MCSAANSVWMWWIKVSGEGDRLVWKVLVLPPIAVPARSHVSEVRADRTGKQKLVRDWAECVL